MRVCGFEFVSWHSSRPRWQWNGIWYSGDMGALSFVYRWRLMLGWFEIRKLTKPK